MTTDSRDRLIALVSELHESHTRTIEPKYPWVFVHVLPKEQKIGSIFAPGSHNKPIHEAIVLKTWKPFYRYASIGKTGFESLLVESELKPGDHVLFPHWCGLPVPGYDTMDYRIVKEEGWSKDSDGGIHSVVEYDSPNCTATLLNTIHDNLYDEPIDSMHDGEVNLYKVMLAIESRFILIDRKVGSSTLSGK